MRDHHEFDSPVDLPGAEPGVGAPLRWTTITILTASLFLLATNAATLREWVEEQTPGPRQAQLAALAVRWEAATSVLGLGTPRAALHRQWKAVQAARFSEDQR